MCNILFFRYSFLLYGEKNEGILSAKFEMKSRIRQLVLFKFNSADLRDGEAGVLALDAMDGAPCDGACRAGADFPRHCKWTSMLDIFPSPPPCTPFGVTLGGVL